MFDKTLRLVGVLACLALFSGTLSGCSAQVPSSATSPGGSDANVTQDVDAESALANAFAALPAGRELTYDNARFEGSGYSLQLSIDGLAGRWPGDAPPVIIPGQMRLTGFTLDEPELDTASEEFRQMGWDMLEEQGLQDKYSPDDLAADYQYVRARVATEDNPSEEAVLLFHCFKLGDTWYFFQDA